MKNTARILGTTLIGAHLAFFGLSASAEQSDQQIAAPFKYAKQVVNEESLDMQSKLQRIQDYVDRMPQQYLSEMVHAVGSERFIPRQAISLGQDKGFNTTIPASQAERLQSAMQSDAASKQIKRVLAQYLYADASRPVYAEHSEGMLATRIPTPSN